MYQDIAGCIEPRTFPPPFVEGHGTNLFGQYTCAAKHLWIVVPARISLIPANVFPYTVARLKSRPRVFLHKDQRNSS